MPRRTVWLLLLLYVSYVRLDVWHVLEVPTFEGSILRQVERSVAPGDRIFGMTAVRREYMVECADPVARLP